MENPESKRDPDELKHRAGCWLEPWQHEDQEKGKAETGEEKGLEMISSNLTGNKIKAPGDICQEDKKKICESHDGKLHLLL